MLTGPAARPAVFVERLARVSSAHARLVTVAAAVLGVVAVMFAVSHFSMTTDTDQLISKRLAWRQRETAFNRLFAPEGEQIVIVVDGATPELTERAAAEIAGVLHRSPSLFHDVVRPEGGDFLAREGLLYAPSADVRRTLDQLIAAQPFLGPVAADPSLRGVMGSLGTALQGVTSGQARLDELDRPIAALAQVVERQRAGARAFFSWRTLIAGGPPDRRELRQVVLASPTLDYDRLQPGAAPTAFIRAAAKRLSIDAAHGATARLTGPVPLQDEELASLADRALLIGFLAAGAIVGMLWLAVRSWRVIGAILATTLLGLVCAMAVGLAVFHRFNVISVAFIPLFVGLGIDFGIQFSVRFRTEQDGGADVRQSLAASARGMGRSLALAATAIACGFLSFAPTPYVGLSQLGVIAGLGMFIALGLNLTVLPALLALLAPSPRIGSRPSPMLERLDTVILAHRWLVVGSAVVAALGCACLLPWLTFDFNPVHLKNAASESVRTLADLTADPDLSPDTMEVVRPTLPAAQAMAARLRRLPSVREARTLADFLPPDQAPKLAAIADAANLLDLTLDPIVVAPPPADAEVVASLRQTAAALRGAASSPDQEAPRAAADARRLAGDLEWLAAAPPSARARASASLVDPLQTLLGQIRAMLQAAPVSLDNLPVSIRRDWIAPDGRARISATPRGDPNDNAVMDRFIDAVEAAAPDATGVPFDTREGGRTVAAAFAEAGVLSFVAIVILLLAVLRRVRDVAITMAPIVLTGVLTLGTCVLIGQPLNFANIIALPLLFGIGVAFHIYFVMAWRAGGALLQSSLTKAIFFSALATATGFGSLWASSHPGTASMGKLLMISLVWTLVSALIFQPALMGPSKAEADRL